jgi:hypothetical protein
MQKRLTAYAEMCKEMAANSGAAADSSDAKQMRASFDAQFAATVAADDEEDGDDDEVMGPVRITQSTQEDRIENLYDNIIMRDKQKPVSSLPLQQFRCHACAGLALFNSLKRGIAIKLHAADLCDV